MFSSSSALVVTKPCTPFYFRVYFRVYFPLSARFTGTAQLPQADNAHPRSSLHLYLTSGGGCPRQVAWVRGVCARGVFGGAGLEVTELGPDLVREWVRQAVE